MSGALTAAVTPDDPKRLQRAATMIVKTGDEEDDRDVVAERTAVQTAEARGNGVEEPGEHRGLFIDSRGAG